MNQPCRRQTAAGRFSGNLMTKVTVYFRTIRSGFNKMSADDLLDMDYFLNEEDDFDDEEGEEGFYLF